MSKLQKWCPNYTQVCTLAEPGGCLTRAMGYAPGLSAPRCPISVLAPQFLGGIPSITPRYWFLLPACILQGGGAAKSYEALKRLFATWPKPRLPLPLPTKTLIKFQETGRTGTHTLQVLHSLYWHQPSKDERALRPKPSPWLATPTPTRHLELMMIMSQALVAYL